MHTFVQGILGSLYKTEHVITVHVHCINCIDTGDHLHCLEFHRIAITFQIDSMFFCPQKLSAINILRLHAFLARVLSLNAIASIHGIYIPCI